MRSTFYGLEIAKTGLFISQNQLDVTGHNICLLYTSADHNSTAAGVAGRAFGR